jgi:hypothetical protein
MATVVNAPVIVTRLERPESYPIELRNPVPQPSSLALVTAPPQPTLWAASQL